MAEINQNKGQQTQQAAGTEAQKGPEEKPGLFGRLRQGGERPGRRKGGTRIRGKAGLLPM